MNLHDVFLIILAFGSEILGTLSGFGSSTFFVPSAVLFESFKFVLALTAILHCFGNLFRVLIFRDHFDLRIFLQLVLPSVIFTGIGAALTVYFPPHDLEFTLGIVLMIIALIFLFHRAAEKHIPKWLAVILSGISGFTTGFVGTGGAIRGIALAALHIEKNSFVAVSSAIDIGGDFLRAG
ncbi:MAG: TSUP family transporter, partial [Bdellovibrionales bacterium]